NVLYMLQYVRPGVEYNDHRAYGQGIVGNSTAARGSPSSHVASHEWRGRNPVAQRDLRLLQSCFLQRGVGPDDPQGVAMLLHHPEHESHDRLLLTTGVDLSRPDAIAGFGAEHHIGEVGLRRNAGHITGEVDMLRS